MSRVPVRVRVRVRVHVPVGVSVVRASYPGADQSVEVSPQQSGGSEIIRGVLLRE